MLERVIVVAGFKPALQIPFKNCESCRDVVRSRVVLWKNGVTQYLTDGILDASAISVFVVE